MDDTSALRNAARAVEGGNAAGVQFVIQQLELGLKYCDMATNAETEPSAQRHEANANRAYQAAMLHVKSLSLTRAERTAFDQRETRLRAFLEEANRSS